MNSSNENIGDATIALRCSQPEHNLRQTGTLTLERVRRPETLDRKRRTYQLVRKSEQERSGTQLRAICPDNLIG